MFAKIGEFLKRFGQLLIRGELKDKLIAWAIVIALAVVTTINVVNLLNPNPEKEIGASTFIAQLDANNVEELHISNIDGSVSGKFKEKTDDGVLNFKSSIPERSEAFTQKYLTSQDRDLKYDYVKTPGWVSTASALLMTLLQVGLFGILFLWIFGRFQGDALLPFGEDPDDAFGTEIPNATFDDLAGIPEAIEEVSELVDFLKDPEIYAEAGAQVPHGILMEGPPGVGKTALARALAGEAGVHFISASGSDFVKIYVGQGAKRVRELFAQARKHQPSILFIDEIDAVGGNRDAGLGMHDEHLQTINALLKEMDGFKKDGGNIIVIAATNRASSLDPALTRPGRFNRVVSIDTPSKEGRVAILKHYAQGRPFSEEVDFERLAAHTCGLSGAELENVMNEAATLAARRAKDTKTPPMIQKEDLDEGISRTISGPALKSKMMGEEEKRQVAYHEAGHAVVQYMLPQCDPVQKISIVSRRIPNVGTAMGYVQSYSEEDSYVTSKEQIEADIASLFGGRVSEKMYCNIETAGASNDLQRATQLAYDMVCRYAFESPNGDQSWQVEIENRKHEISERQKERIDDKVDAILEKAHETAKRTITRHRREIEKIVETLLEQETIDADEIQAIMESVKEGQ